MIIVIDMRHRFKAKKRTKNVFLKIGIIVLIIIISFILTFKWLFQKINIYLDNETYIDYLVHDSFGMYSLEDIASLSSVDFLLKYSFGLEHIDTGLVNKEITTPIEIESESSINKEPLVYIFNTHQTESYKSNLLEAFNINNTVLMASYILKEYLDDLNVPTLVEKNSIVDILNTNGWKYGYSYKASRILLEEAYKNNHTLKYFIDLHRDSSSYEYTTIEMEGKKYAKVLFVIGLEYDTYQNNLQMASSLNEKIKNINPSLSRGIIKKEGKGVNGVYNQDFSPNCILIEVGGQYNTIEEVNNTLNIVAKVLFDYINEVSNEKEKS